MGQPAHGDQSTLDLAKNKEHEWLVTRAEERRLFKSTGYAGCGFRGRRGCGSIH